ncbi:MAG: alpha-amylase [Lachnospiraceae bacterium]|jgi:alpha-amylase
MYRKENETIFQYFEWYLPENSSLWIRAAVRAGILHGMGITAVWLPPAYKGNGGRSDVGYGVYDTYDLGEFDQKGSVATKYGTREEYLWCIRTLQAAGIRVYADIVLNHKVGADETEEITAIEQNPSNRLEETHGPEKISAWTKFTFPGRRGKYSDFVWDASCFDGTDWDENRKKKSIYLFSGKGWDPEVDNENGNYDYLMGCDVDFDSPKVREELLRWGEWYTRTAQMDGYRLDALKHISRKFYPWWLGELRKRTGRELPTVGEYWTPDCGKLTAYLKECGNCMSLFDVPLHYHFREASWADGKYPMRNILDGTLLSADAEHTVTFVDNHDTQPGQSLESFVNSWFKKIAYAIILLRGYGTPCVFWGDLYGIPHNHIMPVEGLSIMMKERQLYAYGELHDYFDDDHIVGFTREGSPEYRNSGIAAVMTDGDQGVKTMYVGKRFAGTEFVDTTGGVRQPVIIDENGNGTFSVLGGNASVWVTQAAACDLFRLGYTF